MASPPPGEESDEKQNGGERQYAATDQEDSSGKPLWQEYVGDLPADCADPFGVGSQRASPAVAQQDEPLGEDKGEGNPYCYIAFLCIQVVV